MGSIDHSKISNVTFRKGEYATLICIKRDVTGNFYELSLAHQLSLFPSLRQLDGVLHADSLMSFQI